MNEELSAEETIAPHIVNERDLEDRDWAAAVSRLGELLDVLDERQRTAVEWRYSLGRWRREEGLPPLETSAEELAQHLDVEVADLEIILAEALQFLNENGRSIPHRE